MTSLMVKVPEIKPDNNCTCHKKCCFPEFIQLIPGLEECLADQMTLDTKLRSLAAICCQNVSPDRLSGPAVRDGVLYTVFCALLD